MGYTLTVMDTEHAKTVARAWAWEVFEASLEKYFENKKWLKDVTLAEQCPEKNEIHFTLKGGDFVTVERKLS